MRSSLHPHIQHHLAISIMVVVTTAATFIYLNHNATSNAANPTVQIGQADTTVIDPDAALPIPKTVSLPLAQPSPTAEAGKTAANTQKSRSATPTTSNNNPNTPTTPTATPTPSVAPNPSTPPPNDPIKHWGAVVRLYALKGSGEYQRDHLIQQLDLLKELGATDSRTNAEEDLLHLDDFVNLSIEKNLTPTIILEPLVPHYLDTDTYNRAYNYAYTIAKRYGSRVKYYQLANEASGVAIKPGFAGNRRSDYDETKYQKLKETLRGLGEGVRAANPSAYRIVSANWLGTGVIDRLMDDHIQFEIVGWNWYSDMGDDLIKKLDDGSTLNIPEYVKQYSKTFWIVEANRREGSFDGNFTAQANYIRSLVSHVASHHNTKGFFIFTLTDQCSELDKDYGNLGLVHVKKNNDGTCSISDQKHAFRAYKEMIAQYQ